MEKLQLSLRKRMDFYDALYNAYKSDDYDLVEKIMNENKNCIDKRIAISHLLVQDVRILNAVENASLCVGEIISSTWVSIFAAITGSNYRNTSQASRDLVLYAERSFMSHLMNIGCICGPPKCMWGAGECCSLLISRWFSRMLSYNEDSLCDAQRKKFVIAPGEKITKLMVSIEETPFIHVSKQPVGAYIEVNIPSPVAATIIKNITYLRAGCIKN